MSRFGIAFYIEKLIKKFNYLFDMYILICYNV